MIKLMLSSMVVIVLYAFSLATIISELLITKLNLNLFAGQFSKQIPSFTMMLGQMKTFDILYFVLIILFSASISFIYIYFLKIQHKKNSFLDFFNLTFSVLLYLQTHFVRYSYRDAIIVFVIIQVIYFSLKKVNIKEIKFTGWFAVGNGFLAGFFCMLLVRHFTTSMLLTLGTIFLAMFLYQILSNYSFRRYLTSPAHLILFLAIINSWNIYYLLFIGLAAFLSIVFIKNYPEKLIKNIGFIYSLTFLGFFAYNPNFYAGNLDSVEEGVWFGWLQRLLTSQMLYKDAALYQPPLVIWGLHLFDNLFGVSLYWSRLYFEILRVGGILLIFVSFRGFINKKINLILSTLLFLSLPSSLVRNNVEIRIGVGLFGLYLLYKYFNDYKKRWLILAGVISSLSFFVSVEVGIASLVASLLGILINFSGFLDFIKKTAIWFAGVISASGLIIGILYLQGALSGFVSQIYFYSRAFSSGYFNLAVERIQPQNILQWESIDRYISSTAFFWEINWFCLSIAVVFFLYRFITKSFIKKDSLPFMILIFNLVLSRAELGRSDSYHLLFTLITSLVMLIYLLEYFDNSIQFKFISSTMLIIFLLIVFRSGFQQVFLNDQFFKLQSYANISQGYNILESSRANIALGVDYPVNDMDSLIKFIDSNTTKTDKIFVYPWQPEIYFLTDRNNATSFDTPYAFFTFNYQEKMINELKLNKPRYIIYNPQMNFGEMSPKSLVWINEYIGNNYKAVESIGRNNIMVLK